MADEADKASAALRRPKKASHTTAGPAESEAVPQAGEEIEEETGVDDAASEAEEDKGVQAAPKQQESAVSSAGGPKTTPSPASGKSQPSLAHMLRFERRRNKPRR